MEKLREHRLIIETLGPTHTHTDRCIHHQMPLQQLNISHVLFAGLTAVYVPIHMLDYW